LPTTGVEQDVPLFPGQRVQPRGDHGPHGGRELIVGPVALQHPRGHLFDEQRVPARRRLDPLGDSGLLLADEARGQPMGGSGWEGLQSHRGRGRQTSAPCRPQVEQFRAREGEEQDRRVSRAARERGDEVQGAGVRPVDVLEHDQGSGLRRQCLDEPTRRLE